MKGPVIVIMPDGRFGPSPLEPDENGSTLKCLQRHVGGLIEHVSPRFPDMDGLDLWVNEEGKLLGLAPNPVATALSSVFGRDVLVGPCVVARTDAEGETRPLTPDDVGRLLLRLGGVGGHFDEEAAGK